MDKLNKLEQEFYTKFKQPFEHSIERLPSLMIALQYCPIDRDQALDLIDLIIKLEDTPREDIIFAISYRNDTKIPPEGLLSELRKKFQNVVLWKGFRDSRGHPAGCNALWIDTMTHACEEGERRNISGVFTMEADDIPIRKDWITRLQIEWHYGRIMESRRVIGHLMPKVNNCPEHINGNALFDSQILRYFQPLSQCPPVHAWDVYGARYFRPVWKDSKYIINLYRHREVSIEKILELQRDDVSIIHGIKDDSLVKIVKKMF